MISDRRASLADRLLDLLLLRGQYQPFEGRDRLDDLCRRRLFTSERGSPFTTAGFAWLVERAGAAAGFKPHMLRHACGFALANKGHDTRALQAYLGHRNIQHTVRYTELSPDRFKDFWRWVRAA